MHKLFDPKSNDNTLFITNQCNNHCLMCCQPPKSKDDSKIIHLKNEKVIKESPLNIPIIGITGGEPTIVGEHLFTLINLIQEKYPESIIHLLTNGRMFHNKMYAKRFLNYDLSKFTFGIPLHSDFLGDHDTITQVKGSFNETMQGLYNLADINANIELRIIINKINYKRLPKISDFIFYNLPFVSDIAFIGMENIGLAIKNQNLTWIDPIDYQNELIAALKKLVCWGLTCCIYNIPLCALDKTLHQYSWKSISDWKVKYQDECELCILKEKCGGLFATSLWQSKGIHPIKK